MLDERLIYFFVLENYGYISVILVDILRFSKVNDFHRFSALSYFFPDFIVRYFPGFRMFRVISVKHVMEQGA